MLCKNDDDKDLFEICAEGNNNQKKYILVQWRTVTIFNLLFTINFMVFKQLTFISEYIILMYLDDIWYLFIQLEWLSVKFSPFTIKNTEMLERASEKDQQFLEHILEICKGQSFSNIMSEVFPMRSVYKADFLNLGSM